MSISQIINHRIDHIFKEEPTEQEIFDLILFDEDIEAAEVEMDEAVDVLPNVLEQIRFLSAEKLSSELDLLEKSK